MNVEAARSTFASASQASEHFDVLIVGAGISGICSAYHFRTKMPGTSFVILETMETFGGTWWTHKYPDIRSDSDLHTFGYSFKPWVGPPIASAAEIRAYMGEVDRKSTRLNSSHLVISYAVFCLKKKKKKIKTKKKNKKKNKQIQKTP